MKVKLEVLGFDRGMWGNLEHFSGLVVDCYYQEVTRAPMFSVQFGGSVGTREVRVCKTAVDEAKLSALGAQRTLNFVSSSSGCESCATATTATGPSGIASILIDGFHHLHPATPLLSDSDVDLDWVAEYADFAEDAEDGMAPCPFYLANLYVSVAFGAESVFLCR
jgi:hypothetical protein